MSNFLTSLKKGLHSAMSSRNEQLEIDEVIAELNRQILEMTEKTVSVEIGNYSRPSKRKEGASLSELFVPEKFRAFAIRWNDEGNKSKPIADWLQDGEGYPVKIVWKNVTHTCTNREAFEHMLMKIISDASFGMLIRDIIYDAGKQIITQPDGPKVTSSDTKRKSTMKKL